MTTMMTAGDPAAAMTGYISLRDLTVGYHGRPLISHISLDIRRGEIVSLIGPNGAGKSTILKSLTRQLPIIGGDIRIDGRSIRQFSYREFSTKVAVVLTEKLAPEMMTCRDVVAMGRYPYTGRLGLLTAEDKAIVEEAMASVRVGEIADNDFSAISDGQRQRVLLARAVCQDPEIIILDEPTSYLDIRHKLELLTLLSRMAREKGITVIMSLHEIDFAMKVSDRIISVGEDRSIMTGEPETIVTDSKVRKLYGITQGSFNSLFGSAEMPRPDGDGRSILVLSNNGRGIPVYRRLQKEGRAFTAAVVSRSDLDYTVARELATRLITAEPCEPIGEECLRRVREAVGEASVVIDAGLQIGSTNSGMKEVLDEARRQGKLRSEDTAAL